MKRQMSFLLRTRGTLSNTSTYGIFNNSRTLEFLILTQDLHLKIVMAKKHVYFKTLRFTS